jgi:hypothetical protein
MRERVVLHKLGAAQQRIAELEGGGRDPSAAARRAVIITAIRAEKSCSAIAERSTKVT